MKRRNILIFVYGFIGGALLYSALWLLTPQLSDLRRLIAFITLTLAIFIFTEVRSTIR